MHIISEWRGKVYHTSSNDNFYMSPKWRKLRREVFYRDVFCCLRCGKRLTMDKLTAHHLIPHAEGGLDDKPNLVTLCGPCHDFVEIKGMRTRAEIMGSMAEDVSEAEIDEQQRPDDVQEDDELKRPVWHAWVYGGKRHRL